jgi:serine/threonine-protein kinase HipA
VDNILKRPGQIQWLTDAEIAQRLEALKKDPSAWRSAQDTGQLSLAGAQPKTAFIYRDGRWGVPSGRIPTTHIFKPPNDAFRGHAENEHVCLQLAGMLGLPVAESRVLKFEKQVAIVVSRYDRLASGRTTRRVHQEDMCQALACPPTSKYQNQGGPSAKDIIDFLRIQSGNPQEDVCTFVEALGFNWLIGGTDAHAKNYSMLIGAGGRARLAPLYDVASILPYDFDRKKLKLAMSIGREYLLEYIGWRKWVRFSEQTHFPTELLRQQLRDLALQLPDALAQVVRSARAEGLSASALDAIAKPLRGRAALCLKELS